MLPLWVIYGGCRHGWPLLTSYCRCSLAGQGAAPFLFCGCSHPVCPRSAVQIPACWVLCRPDARAPLALAPPACSGFQSVTPQLNLRSRPPSPPPRHPATMPPCPCRRVPSGRGAGSLVLPAAAGGARPPAPGGRCCWLLLGRRARRGEAWCLGMGLGVNVLSSGRQSPSGRPALLSSARACPKALPCSRLLPCQLAYTPQSRPAACNLPHLLLKLPCPAPLYPCRPTWSCTPAPAAATTWQPPTAPA